MPSTAYDLIAQAIAAKSCISASYNGYHREMCPHTLGYSKKGDEQALCYQYGGQSSTGIGPDGDPNNWRCVVVSKLSNVTLINGPWHTAPNHTMPQTCVADVRHEAAH